MSGVNKSLIIVYCYTIYDALEDDELSIVYTTHNQ